MPFPLLLQRIRNRVQASQPVPLLPLSGRARGELIGFRTMAVPLQTHHGHVADSSAGRSPIQPAALPAATARSHVPAMGTHRAGMLRSRVSPSRLSISGRLGDVCAELERLVAQEEHLLHAG